MVGFNCRLCGEGNDAEVTIDTPSTPAYLGGLPEDCYPGEGCEWHVEAEVACVECDAVHDTQWIETAVGAEVVERECEERHESRGDYRDE